MNQIPTEAQEQAALMQWLAYAEMYHPELRLLHHIPNGGGRNPIEAKHLKEQGVKAGIPDLFLPCARGGWHGLYIEMKRRKGGRVSIEQKKTIIALRVQGYRVEVCEGWEKARDVIKEYMEGENGKLPHCGNAG
jgi:hypothetical protein